MEYNLKKNKSEKYSSSRSNRILFLELLRIFACFWVIYNHTNGFGIYTEVSTSTVQYYIYLVVSLICKTAVPLFFMISGAILLGKIETRVSLFRKIKDVIIQIVLINLLYVLYRYIRYNDPKTIKEVLSFIYSGAGLSAHIWYMYAYLSYILIIPILNIVSKYFDEKLLIYILSIIFLYKITEAFQYFALGNKIRISPYLEPSWLMSDIFIYPLVGYLYTNIIIKISRKKAFLYFVVAVISILIPVMENVLVVKINGGTYDGISAQTFHNKFVPFLSIAIFVFFKWVYQTIRSRIKQSNLCTIIKKTILCVSETTYGIYIVHIIIKDYPTIKDLPDLMIAAGLNGLIANMLYVTLVFIISFILIKLFKIVKQVIKNFAKNRSFSITR